MFASIASMLAGPMIEKLLGPFTDIFKQYLSNQITREELKNRLQIELVKSSKEVEVEHAKAITDTYSSFMTTAAKSPLMQRVWAIVVLSQLLVLLFHQVGIPFIVYVTGRGYPSSGTTVEWAYLLLGFCLGAGPLILRSGPAAPKKVV